MTFEGFVIWYVVVVGTLASVGWLAEVIDRWLDK